MKFAGVFKWQMLVFKTYFFKKLSTSDWSSSNYQTNSANKNNSLEFSCRTETFFPLFVLENRTN